MNCREIQDHLLAADSLAADALPPVLALHLAECPACESLRLKLFRLEAAARALPLLPGSAIGNQAKESFLRQLQPRRQPSPIRESPLRILMRQGWRAPAVAAAIMLLLGGTVWLALTRNAANRSALAARPLNAPATAPAAVQTPDSSVVDKLVDLNLDLSNAATPAERNQIFAEQAAPLKATLEQVHLAPEEKELASKLLENGKWLSSNTDPLDEAERLDNVAGLLFDRLQTAAPAGDAKVLSRLTRRYGLVAARIDDARARLAHAATLTPDQKRRYERLIRRQTEVEQRLQDLLQRAPEMSRKEIRKELDSVRKGQKGNRRR